MISLTHDSMGLQTVAPYSAGAGVVCVKFGCPLAATLRLLLHRSTVSRDMSQTTKVLKRQSKREGIKVTMATSMCKW